MKLFRLRERLGKLGQVLLDKGNGLWEVTDNGTGKRSVSHEFKSLEDVEMWVTMQDNTTPYKG